jgi:hypothetical protein
VHKIAIDALLYEEWTGRLRSPRPELRKLAKKR